MSKFNEWMRGYFEGKPSLRTFKVGDHPFNADEQEVLETERYVAAVDNEVYDAGFDQWMQSVDWDTVDQMVQNMVDRSGVKDKMVNNIWPGRIINETDDPNWLGQFELNGNYIGLNNELLEKLAETAKINVDVLRTQVLFHEIVHASAKHENQVSYKSFKSASDILKEFLLEQFSILRKPSTDVTVSSSNYYTNEIRIHRDKTGKKIGEEEIEFNSFFNDAIVEKMSVEMLRDYAQRTGKFSQADLENFDKNYLRNENVNPGAVYIIFMDTIVEVLAAYNEMDEMVVWQAFVRGQFNEKPFDDAGVQQMFAEAFYPEFLAELGMVKTDAELLRLITKTAEKMKEKSKK